MSDPIQLDAAAGAVLSSLQAMFSPVAVVAPVSLKHPRLVAEFRPGGATDTDLAEVPKPGESWAFGVELGDVSSDGRLCALVFTQFARLEAFYGLNPALHGTLVSCWRGGAAIWLKAAGRIPRDFTADGVHWSISGIIPVGCPKQPAETFISQAGEVKWVEFDRLVWTEQQKAEVEQLLLEAEVGPPFRTVARGRRVLNLGFWARYFTSLLPVAYDEERSLFEWGTTADGNPILLNDSDSVREFTHLLQSVAPSFGAAFPQGEIRPARVRQLVERIKLLTTKSRASDDEVLDNFLASEVVRAPGKVITSFEFRARYVTYCQGLGRTPCSESRFFRALKAKLHGMGIDQRHDIDRNGRPVRGYGGVTLREVASQEADGPDATDTTDGA